MAIWVSTALGYALWLQPSALTKGISAKLVDTIDSEGKVNVVIVVKLFNFRIV